jgi:hypothetical protein
MAAWVKDENFEATILRASENKEILLLYVVGGYKTIPLRIEDYLIIIKLTCSNTVYLLVRSFELNCRFSFSVLEMAQCKLQWYVLQDQKNKRKDIKNIEP